MDVKDLEQVCYLYLKENMSNMSILSDKFTNEFRCLTGDEWTIEIKWMNKTSFEAVNYKLGMHESAERFEARLWSDRKLLEQTIMKILCRPIELFDELRGRNSVIGAWQHMIEKCSNVRAEYLYYDCTNYDDIIRLTASQIVPDSNHENEYIRLIKITMTRK